jgi:hypothetical protein
LVNEGNIAPEKAVVTVNFVYFTRFGSKYPITVPNRGRVGNKNSN